jgi:hypothetical protein
VSKRSTLVAIVVLLSTSCAGDEPDSAAASPSASPSTSVTASPNAEPIVVGTVTIAQDGCTLDMGGPVIAGEVAFEVENTTDGLGAANVAELVGGTFRDLERHIHKEVRLAEEGRPGLGHPGFAVPSFEVLVDAGGSGTMSGTLDPGTYALTCAKVFEAVGELRPLAALGPVEVE